MKKSEILKILGSSVKSYRVIASPNRAWLEVRVESIHYNEISNIYRRLLQIEPVNEDEILLVFDSETIID